jgi:hypothetical protein
MAATDRIMVLSEGLTRAGPCHPGRLCGIGYAPLSWYFADPTRNLPAGRTVSFSRRARELVSQPNPAAVRVWVTGTTGGG